MAKNDVNLDDLQATASVKVDEIQENVQDAVETVKNAKLTSGQTAIVVVLVAAVTSLVVRKIVKKRAERLAKVELVEELLNAEGE